MADISTPAAMDGIKFKQMRCGRGPALDLIEVDDIKSGAGVSVSLIALNPAKGIAQGKATDTPHSIDSDFHFHHLCVS